MSKKIPDHISKEIKERVFQEADQVNYLARSRTDNGTFLDRLVSMHEVGGALSGYIKKDEIRTYIKDAILNRYSKDKTQEKRPQDLNAIIKDKIDINATLVHKYKQITLFKASDGLCFIVISDGTVLKWETALRKALLYIASKSSLIKKETKIIIILTLFARHQKVLPSDMNQLDKALSLCNARLYIYGDS